MNVRSKENRRPTCSTSDTPEDGYVSRIILAEDDTELRALVRDALRADGYEVTEVANGRQLRSLLDAAISGQDHRGIDLIITDNRMPKCTGLDVLTLLRDRDWATPVILITAFGTKEIHEEAMRLGVAEVFDKPFKLQSLRAAAKRLSPPNVFNVANSEQRPYLG